MKQSSDSPDYPIFPFSNTSIPGSSAPRVLFPPSPELAQTYFTHSVIAYDRTPIVVAPNDCELPERGCPGRTYGAACESDDGVDRALDYFQSKRREGSDLAGEERPSIHRMPPLVPDLSSSDSEDSDDLLSPPNVDESAFIPFFHRVPKTLAMLPHEPLRRESKPRSPRSYEDQFKNSMATSAFAAYGLDSCLAGF